MSLPQIPESISSCSTVRLQQLLGDLRKLPLFPATAQQAMALVQQENACLRKLCQLLETDITLAASILKLANSPLFNWGQPIDSLEKAVVRMGLSECRNLILAVSMRNVFQAADPATKGLCAVLWNHCFLTACLCRRLNRELQTDFHGEEFAAGLLHDLGRILLAVTMPREFPHADPMDFVENAGLTVREAEVMGTDHCYLGSIYAEQNDLPAPTQAVMRYHHDIESASEHRKVIGLVAAADHMANYLQRCQDPRAYDLNLNPGIEFMTRTWSREKRNSLAKSIPTILTETIDAAVRQASPRKTPANGSARPRVLASEPPTKQPSFLAGVKSMFGM